MHVKGEDSDEEDDDEPPRFTKWTLRRVVQYKKRLAIKQRLEELSHEKGETTHTIRLYPTACTEICEELTHDERHQFEELVQKWNAAGVPEEIQQK